MAVETKVRPHAAQTSDRLRLEFLLLDLTTCTRCLGADRSLESALDIVREVLQATGVEVEVDKIVVESADQARALRFVISPTVRVDGHDVALELRESLCGSEACGDGCGDQIACRMWVHRGHEYTDPPVAMIVDAILGHVSAARRPGGRRGLPKPPRSPQLPHDDAPWCRNSDSLPTGMRASSPCIRPVGVVRWIASTNSHGAVSRTRGGRGGRPRVAVRAPIRRGRLEAEDLELLATSAYMLGRDDEYVSGLERAHHAYLDAAKLLRAVRCAFWIGINLTLRGEMGRASGWLGRARRLLDREGRDCVEQGYLLVPLIFERQAAGDYEAAIATAAEAVAIGERFGDADLFALAAQAQGILLVKQGRVVEGLGLLDEAMVAVTAGELSPIVNGFVYCGVIVGLSGRVRAAARPGVDGGPDALVRAAARHGQLHRHLSGSSGRDHAAARCVARGAGGGAPGG